MTTQSRLCGHYKQLGKSRSLVKIPSQPGRAVGEWVERWPGNLMKFASELWQFRLPRFASVFGGDTNSHWSLLSGVNASLPGEIKYPTSLHWKCVTCHGLHHS